MPEPRDKGKDMGGEKPAPTSGGEKSTPTSPTSDDTEEWILTVNKATYELVKAEKVDMTSGQRQELSLDECSALFGQYGTYESYGMYADPYGSYGNASSYDPYTYEEGYSQGIADYEAAQGREGSGYGYSSVEQAYYQGMADYEAALSGY